MPSTGRTPKREISTHSPVSNERFGGERCCTAVLLDLDTNTGKIEGIRHGKHQPSIIRQDET
ncbi:hypothetical protein ACFVUB_20270 [Streptomyces niveus]|uniref:hypothetical protein n=1 Tax=Streptomyces niveus TaxID=193462 RepID=UPI0036DA9B3D